MNSEVVYLLRFWSFQLFVDYRLVLLSFSGMFTSRQPLLEMSLCKQYFQVIKSFNYQPLIPPVLFSASCEYAEIL